MCLTGAPAQQPGASGARAGPRPCLGIQALVAGMPCPLPSPAVPLSPLFLAPWLLMTHRPGVRIQVLMGISGDAAGLRAADGKVGGTGAPCRRHTLGPGGDGHTDAGRKVVPVAGRALPARRWAYWLCTGQRCESPALGPFPSPEEPPPRPICLCWPILSGGEAASELRD